MIESFNNPRFASQDDEDDEEYEYEEYEEYEDDDPVLTATSSRKGICSECGKPTIYRTFSNCFGQEIGSASDCCRLFREFG